MEKINLGQRDNQPVEPKKETKQTGAEITLPNNAEIKKLWPDIYTKIKDEIKEPSNLEPFEKRIREILKSYLGTELIKTDSDYKKFFQDALKLAIHMDTDKMLFRIEGGRRRYGEAGKKGRIPDEFSNNND